MKNKILISIVISFISLNAYSLTCSSILSNSIKNSLSTRLINLGTEMHWRWVGFNYKNELKSRIFERRYFPNPFFNPLLRRTAYNSAVLTLNYVSPLLDARGALGPSLHQIGPLENISIYRDVELYTEDGVLTKFKEGGIISVNDQLLVESVQ